MLEAQVLSWRLGFYVGGSGSILEARVLSRRLKFYVEDYGSIFED